MTRKGFIGAKLHSGSTMTRKSVNLTRNVTQSWVNLTPLFVKSGGSWQISVSSLTRNGVWPQWTLFRVPLTRVFLECIQNIFIIRLRISFCLWSIATMQDHCSFDNNINKRQKGTSNFRLCYTYWAVFFFFFLHTVYNRGYKIFTFKSTTFALVSRYLCIMWMKNLRRFLSLIISRNYYRFLSNLVSR